MSKNQLHSGKSGHDDHEHHHKADDKGTKLNGRSGDDVLTGTERNDDLSGGKGNDLLVGLGGNDKLNGGNGDDRLFGGAGDDRLDGGKGNDFLDGGAGNDLLIGGEGNDRLFGGAGDDILYGDEGGKEKPWGWDDCVWWKPRSDGDDFLDGGAGNDKVFAGRGDDVAFYSMAGNLGAGFADIGTRDSYDGGTGFDTLQLALTSGELLLGSVQQDIAAFQAFLAENANPRGDNGPAFHFSSFDLTVRDFEALAIQHLVNTAPTAQSDAGSTNEDTLLLLAAPGVLANDTDPDHLDILSVVGASAASTLGAVVLVGANGSYSYNPTGALALQQLAQGATTTDSFSYTIADLAGATSTATVQIVVTGVNDVPVAVNDAKMTDEDTPVAGNVLVNDTDVDTGDVLRVGAVNGESGNVGTAITLASGALLTVNAGGSYSYDPNDRFESLAVGQSAADSFTYVATDNHGAPSNTATVNLTVTGVNDAPVAADDSITGTGGGGPIRVAVVGGINSTYIDAAEQLEDSTDFRIDADAISIAAFDTEAKWPAALAKYDVVVVGENGAAPFDYNGSQIFAALRDFVNAGGGVVTTGWFAGKIAAYSDPIIAADANYISPAAPFGESLFVREPSSITVLDPSHPIAGGIASYAVQGFVHELAGAFDASATVLARGGASALPAIVYDEVGTQGGLTVFLGSLHMASPGFFRPEETRDGATDQLFEQAVAWAAGDQGGSDAATDEDTALVIDDAFLLANDTDVDTGDVLAITAVSATSALGAAVTLNDDGSLTYNPTGSATLQAMAAGTSKVDSFSYSISDGHGGTDTATVNVTVAGLNEPASGAGSDKGAQLVDQYYFEDVPVTGLNSSGVNADMESLDYGSFNQGHVEYNADGSNLGTTVAAGDFIEDYSFAGKAVAPDVDIF